MPVYYYNGIARCALCFGNPNICGAFLTLLLIFMVGFLDYSTLESKAEYVRSWIVVGLALLTGCLLVCTYSRAAYLAVAVSLLFLSIRRRTKAAYLSLVLFTILICLFPSGAKRVASSTDFHEGSIVNRILLWKGAAAMIAQRPFKGIAFHEIGDYYRAVFLPLDIDAHYSTMQNDWLTLGCVYGIGLPFVLGTILMTLVLSGAILSFCSAISPRDRSILVGCAAVIIAYISVAFFNTFYFRVSIVSLLGIAIAGEAFELVKIVRCNRDYLWLIVKLSACAVGLSFCLALTVLFWGRSVLNGKPFQMMEIDSGDGLENIPVIRRRERSPLLLHVRQCATSFDEREEKKQYLPVLYDDFRYLYRSAAENGFDFSLLEVFPGEDGIRKLTKKLTKIQMPFILLCNEDVAYLLFDDIVGQELADIIGSRCEIVICCQGEMYEGGKDLKQIASRYFERVLFITPGDNQIERGVISQSNPNFCTASLPEDACQIDFCLVPELLRLILEVSAKLPECTLICPHRL